MALNTCPAPRAATAGPNSYVRRLDAAWQAHLAPRATDAPTVISLFAGCGGSSLGYSMAGYRELLAVEWDDNAVATFRLNFPDVPVYHGDIAALSAADVLTQTGLAPGQLDVLDGSPPCQGFSTAGKRQQDDPRNGLFREYVRLLDGLRPRAFVMENVSGMVKGKMRLVFVEMLQAFKNVGYRVSVRLLNAMYFDVPQARERVIVIGVRIDEPGAPGHPIAQTWPVTVRRALANLPDLGPTAPSADRGRVAPMMAHCLVGRSLAASLKQPRFYSWVRAAWDAPCMTIQKSVTYGGFSVWHPDGSRGLTGRELARIASFPDQFVFIGDFAAWVARIGNSVPPLFMRAIAAHVRTTILDANTTARQVQARAMGEQH